MEKEKTIIEVVGKENNIVVDKKTVDSVNKILKGAVPQETFYDSMAIVQNGFRRLWRPNNYRRQIVVKTKSDSTMKNVKSAIPRTRVGKRNKLLFVPYNDILIQYGKNKLTGIYSQRIIDGEKEVFDIEDSTIEKVENEIVRRKEDIRKSIDRALISFARKFGIVQPLEQIIWSRHEDWTLDLEIEKIPDWIVLQGDHMKKVYPSGVEYVGGLNEEPTAQLINRVRNSGLKDFSPDIVAELEEIKLYQTRSEALLFLKENVYVIGDVIKYKAYVQLLSDVEKEEFCDYLFGKFGVFA